MTVWYKSCAGQLYQCCTAVVYSSHIINWHFLFFFTFLQKLLLGMTGFLWSVLSVSDCVYFIANCSNAWIHASLCLSYVFSNVRLKEIDYGKTLKQILVVFYNVWFQWWSLMKLPSVGMHTHLRWESGWVGWLVSWSKLNFIFYFGDFNFDAVSEWRR